MNDPASPLRRGQIVTVALDPAIGSEASKTRPAVVVGNNTANAASARVADAVVTVVPLTTSVARVFGFQVLLPADVTGLPHDSKAQAEQVHTVSVRRIVRAVGWVPAEQMSAVDEVLRLHLALD